jgi:hypothetical protein
MGLLNRIKEGVATIGGFFIGIGQNITNAIRIALGIKPKPPSEKIRAELRQQWLDLAPGEKEIEGVEWEGEIYYETPK